MMNCHHATLMISQAQERPLRLNERIALRLHVMMCSGCRCFADQAPLLRTICQAHPGTDDSAPTEAHLSASHIPDGQAD